MFLIIFLFSLSLHIQELIKRVEENNVSSNQHLFKIKKEHPEEFSVANDLVKKN
ncbi:PRD domain-containing protein [Megamonas funiformis]|uniref:PRD domain-containing protein n=1 Tax=Megamonas funiformis TaxID=437897 RepID=UPI00399BEAAC